MRHEMHPGKRAMIEQLAAEWEREWREERAAILEFEARMSRAEAERTVRGMCCPFTTQEARP